MRTKEPLVVVLLKCTKTIAEIKECLFIRRRGKNISLKNIERIRVLGRRRELQSLYFGNR
jgi:hypothetical protein